MTDHTPHTHGGTDAPECTPHGIPCRPAEPEPVWKVCYTCRDYLADLRHRAVLAQSLADKAHEQGRETTAVVDEFMAAAHRRHLDGKPLRPGGPTRVIDPRLGRLAALMGVTDQGRTS